MAGLHPLQMREPDSVLASWGSVPGSLFFDSGGDISQRSRWRYFCTRPVHRLEMDAQGHVFFDKEDVGKEEIPSCFNRMRDVEAQYGQDDDEGEIFSGGWAGFISYRAGLILNNLGDLSKGQKEPILWAAFYDHVYMWDRQEGKAYLSVHSSVVSSKVKKLIEAWNELPEKADVAPVRQTFSFRSLHGEKAYCEMVERTREHIASGAIFQANITQIHKGEIAEDFRSVDMYRRLRKAIPAPFGAFLNCKRDFQLLSSSPESFLDLSAGGTVCTRPIKGTIARGETKAQDEVCKATLAEDLKERAENLMIVDLMRNDVGRIAAYKTMSVPHLLEVETFSHVHHLVSEVRGELPPGRDGHDLLLQTLPPGSVTGAPKIEAMKIIDAIENYPRGAYCGVIFCKSLSGAMKSSVIIRTIVRHQKTLSVGTGGGITYLSDPQREYQEMLLKWDAFKQFLEGTCH